MLQCSEGGGRKDWQVAGQEIQAGPQTLATVKRMGLGRIVVTHTRLCKGHWTGASQPPIRQGQWSTPLNGARQAPLKLFEHDKSKAAHPLETISWSPIIPVLIMHE
jgi:hypothetical protein|mmetsp:Transcript_7651/g.14609  ORF Transcript_7651/g.14609 Transcript_7651/m.14609 type:complete len:106 (+) Transcript_7651:714-1031(+)